MTPEKLDDILKRYEQDQCTPEERAFVEAWYNNLRTQPPDGLTGASRSAVRARLRQKLEAHVEDTVPAPRPRLGILGMSLRIAAGLALLAATFFIVRGTHTVEEAEPIATVQAVKLLSFINTGTAPARVMLNDGSIVTLRPQGEIKYPAKFTGLREVYLSGQAFFEVKRDEQHPFLVYANGITTKVLGTSFLVTAHPDAANITVAVRTGRVAVFKPGQDRITPLAGQEVILAPNEEAVYNNQSNALVSQSVAQPAALVLPAAQKTRYEAAPVTRVLEDLTRTSGVEIRYSAEDLADYTLTTTLSEESLDNRIGIICKAIGATYTLKNNVISVHVNPNPPPPMK